MQNGLGKYFPLQEDGENVADANYAEPTEEIEMSDQPILNKGGKNKKGRSRSRSRKRKTNYDATGGDDEAVGDVIETSPDEFGETRELKRGLAQRHIQMIALAGTIGTGLFLGSGKAIAEGGPLGALLGYFFVGVLVVGVVLSIAELSALLPLSGAIIRHAEHFVDPALSFAQGWNTVYSVMVSLPAELVAAAVIVQFWSTISSAVWITLFGILLVCSNLLFVRVYGEMEFTFASLKIILIVGLNIMALVLVCGGGPEHHVYGFQFWRDPGPFVQFYGYPGALGRFMGFYTTFQNAVYAYSGIENISIAAAETQAPRRNIPIAAKRVFWRVCIFYVLTIFMIGLLVPSNDPNLLKSTGNAAQSPFVIAATRAGVMIVPHIINAVVLTSAWSVGNSALLGGSRTLYGMAQEGHAPHIFCKTNGMGIPFVAVGGLGLFVALGYLSLSHGTNVIFQWLQNFVAVSALVGWMTICIVYLRLFYGCKKQGIDRSELPWKGPFQPYAAWISLISFGILLLTGGYTVFLDGHWDTETFISSYINIPVFSILYFSYKHIKKTRIIPLDQIPIRHFIEIANANPEEPAKVVTGWRRFNFLWS